MKKSLGERGNFLAGEGWRYTRYGEVRHLATIQPTDSAICGVYSDWFGTGSQKEYEYLASLPKCLKCMKYLNKRKVVKE